MEREAVEHNMISDLANCTTQRAPRNRTISLGDNQVCRLTDRLIKDIPPSRLVIPPIGTVMGNCIEWAKMLPLAFVDLIILDPPYNLDKTFNGQRFAKMSVEDYAIWFDNVVQVLKPMLKADASIYVCCDWITSQSVYSVLVRHFRVQNRITWEREKGRGAKHNWKNACEDIWFCTMSNDYTYNVDAVKMRRKVIAPYKDESGKPKDWMRTQEGNFRDTHPSNFWTDITIPFWSMPENTDHPTQKSEKLIAKLILASSNKGDFVLDPFLGSGTTSVVAKKLERRYLGIEVEEQYCLWAEYRLEQAERDRCIQGYADGVFWERNSAPNYRNLPNAEQPSLLELL
ncbi:MAG: site-specific DNA-methyltransferase [Armatimonadetes bacterium]|nr:site-specific DNA-methyltransferase [Armatimonadota bacterium]